MAHDLRPSLFTALLASALVAMPLGTASRAQTTPQAPAAFLRVLDSNGAPVTNLDESQVSMQVDGAECTAVKLERVEWPTKLTVLIDNGLGSTDPIVPGSLITAPDPHTTDTSASANALPNLRESLRRFLFEVPAGVEVSLVTLAP